MKSGGREWHSLTERYTRRNCVKYQRQRAFPSGAPGRFSGWNFHCILDDSRHLPRRTRCVRCNDMQRSSGWTSAKKTTLPYTQRAVLVEDPAPGPGLLCTRTFLGTFGRFQTRRLSQSTIVPFALWFEGSQPRLRQTIEVSSVGFLKGDLEKRAPSPRLRGREYTRVCALLSSTRWVSVSTSWVGLGVVRLLVSLVQM